MCLYTCINCFNIKYVCNWPFALCTSQPKPARHVKHASNPWDTKDKLRSCTLNKTCSSSRRCARGTSHRHPSYNSSLHVSGRWGCAWPTAPSTGGTTPCIHRSTTLRTVHTSPSHPSPVRSRTSDISMLNSWLLRICRPRSASRGTSAGYGRRSRRSTPACGTWGRQDSTPSGRAARWGCPRSCWGAKCTPRRCRFRSVSRVCRFLGSHLLSYLKPRFRRSLKTTRWRRRHLMMPAAGGARRSGGRARGSTATAPGCWRTACTRDNEVLLPSRELQNLRWFELDWRLRRCAWRRTRCAWLPGCTKRILTRRPNLWLHWKCHPKEVYSVYVYVYEKSVTKINSFSNISIFLFVVAWQNISLGHFCLLSFLFYFTIFVNMFLRIYRY